MKIFFSEECLKYSQAGHPESPLRVKTAYEFLKTKNFVFAEPHLCSEDDILLAHSQKMLQSVKYGNFSDEDTPAIDNIFHYASLAAGSAIDAALMSLKGEKVFSLMRPPGHHATKDSLGGFCYFNNIAIATMKAMQIVDKIAIVDLDCHHGNGTQDIFLGRKDVIYISLHQSHLYPGTGLKAEANCFNYPLISHTEPDVYLETLSEALDSARKFDPDLIAVSMGFDTYKLDPIASLSLEKDTYKQIGKALSGLNKPIFSVLEGGYNHKDLPDCIYQFLRGLE
jgi:acetoin utilization deacetylase AcuC-like enzyme